MEKSRRSPFSEQTMWGLRPVITLKAVLWANFVFSMLFAVIGLLCVILDSQIFSIRVRYDNICNGSLCDIDVDIPRNLTGEIFLRYELTNFYQNNRRFGYSRSDSQLAGEYVSFNDMVACSPYRSIKDDNNESFFLLPCGLFALSVFNDTIEWVNDTTLFNASMVLHKSETQNLFKDISDDYKKGIRWLDTNPLFPGGQTNPHFIVWMRVAPLPHVIKPYAVCKDCHIAAGRYTIRINSNYPTSTFSGEKWVSLAQNTPLDFESKHIGIVFLIVSGVQVLFLCIQITAALFFKRPNVNI